MTTVDAALIADYEESEAMPLTTNVDLMRVSVTDRMKFGPGAEHVLEVGRDACEAVKDISFVAWQNELLEHPLHAVLVAAVVAEVASPLFTVVDGEEERDNPPNRVDDIERRKEWTQDGVDDLLTAGRDAIKSIQEMDAAAWQNKMEGSHLYRDLNRAILAEASGNLPESAKG